MSAIFLHLCYFHACNAKLTSGSPRMANSLSPVVGIVPCGSGIWLRVRRCMMASSSAVNEDRCQHFHGVTPKNTFRPGTLALLVVFLVLTE